MQSTVVGGAMLPHAPQFFTLPETEDKAVVARVREVAADIGQKLRALKPDLWIIFSNDHAEQFFHNVCPAFTVHVGGEASGEFAGRKFHWKIPSEIGFEIVRALYRQGFEGDCIIEHEDRRFEGTDDKVKQGFLIARDILRPYCH